MEVSGEQMRSVRTAAFVAAMLLTLVPITVQAQTAGDAKPPTNEEIVDAFAGVALGAEHQKREPRIIKWGGPVNIGLIGADVPDWVERMLIDHVRDLTLTTGLPVTLAYSERLKTDKRLVPYIRKVKFNMLVFVAPKAELAKTVEKWTKGAFKVKQVTEMLNLGSCHGNLQVSKSGVIRFAYAAIPLEIATQTQYGSKRVDPVKFMKACVVEETTQLLGLINDIDDLDFSIFSDRSKAIDLTPEDRLMLKMLYDPAMKPNMGPEDAVATARKLIGKLRPQ